MGLLRRPALSRDSSGTACRLRTACAPQSAIRRRLQVSPPLATATTSHAATDGGGGHALRGGDYLSFLRVELSDAVFSSASQRGVLATDRQTVMETAGGCVLHPNNSATWLPVVGAMEARGALTSSDRVGAQRFLRAATFQDIFPWLWPDAAGVRVPPGHEAAGAATAADAHVGQETAAPTPKAALAALRSAPPDRWGALVRTVFDASSCESADPSDSLARVQSWQEALFALAANPSFAMSAEQLRTAHACLLRVVEAYYSNCVAAQRTAPPLRCGGTAAAAPEDASATASCFTVTRMPPMLLLQWKRLYRTHFALLDFAELFEAVVCGEEAVAAAAEAAIAVACENGNGYVAPGTFPHRVTTAVLEEDDLFLFYLTIPGRRECGLAWELQWEQTMRHANFAFSRLFRSKLRGTPAPLSPSTAMATTTTTTTGKDLAAHEDAAGMATIRKAAGMLMNVCVWVRNNNEEGTRFLEAAHALLERYFEVVEASAQGLCGEAARPTDAAQSWALVRALREAAFTAMVAKAERLQYACSPGLFDIATAATALEILKPDSDSVITARDVDILLHRSKRSAVFSVWTPAAHHPSSAMASRYGLIAVGIRLVRCLVRASASHTVPRAVLRRLGKELQAWADLVGRPLHLTVDEVCALWSGEVVGKDAASTEAAWADIFDSAVSERAPSNAHAAWTCGCGFTSTCGERSRHGAVAACAACVLRSGVAHSWQCPHCLFTANTSEPAAFCLHCGRAHPALQPRRDVTLSPLQNDVDANNAAGDAAPDSSLFVCKDCHTCSLVAAAADGGDRLPMKCAACGSSRGYARGLFTWRCGCGAGNAATHAHCSVCTRRRAEVVGDEHETQEKKLPEAAPIVADTAPEGFAPVYQCVFCQHDVSLAAHDTDSEAKGPGLYAECPHCQYPHPRHLAAIAEGRLFRCPTCHSHVEDGADVCPSCGSGSLQMLRPLLATQADQPWRCHSCGHSNPLRTRQADRRSDTISTASDGGDDVCAGCAVRQVPPALWEMGRRWGCGVCGAGDNFGVACHHCHALAPGIPAAEVHVWRCPVCVCTLNGSWHERCALPGCGGRHCDAMAAYRERGEEEDAAVPWVMPYAPWGCDSCGRVNLSHSVGQCRGCGSAAASVGAGVAPLAARGEASARAERRAGSAVEGDRPPKIADPHGPLPAVGNGFTAAAFSPMGPQRLTAVERLLAEAAEAADTHPAAMTPFPARAGAESVMASALPSSGVAPDAKAKKDKGQTSASTGGGWEDGYAHAVLRC